MASKNSILAAVKARSGISDEEEQKTILKTILGTLYDKDKAIWSTCMIRSIARVVYVHIF